MAANPQHLALPSRPSKSVSLFMGLLEDMGRSLEPSEAQLAVLERSYASTGEYLTSCPEFEGMLEEVHPHGSRELGTITRPLRRKEGFDVDLVARLNKVALQQYSTLDGAALLLKRLQVAVGRYAERHLPKVQHWSRCVTLEYADGMCADIAPVIDFPNVSALHGDLHGVIPDRELRTFEPTNPRGYTKFFNKVAAISPAFTNGQILKAESSEAGRADVTPLSTPNEVFGRLLCRFIQVMKLHRDYAFDRASLGELSPSSVFITTLATKSYELKALSPHTDELDLLLDVVATMPTLIRREAANDGAEEWYLDNPTAPGDNLASAVNAPERRQAFLQWHAEFTTELSRIVGAIDRREGMDQIYRFVKLGFGERVSASVREAQLAKRLNERQAGRVIAVTAAGAPIPMTARSHTFFGQ